MAGRRRARPDPGRTDPADDLRRQQEHAAQVWRELTASETATALADELSQPMAAILASTQALLRTYRRGPSHDLQSQEAVQDVSREAFRASKIIQRMRFLVQRRQRARHPLDVNQAIRSLAILLQAGAREHGAGLSFDLAPGLPASVGDRTQIQQAVLGIVRNAFETMTALPAEGRVVHVRTEPGEGNVSVTVEHSGPPVDDETMARPFVPFLCQAIVEAHGGRIEATRNQGRGLTVRFSLPAAV